MLLARVLCNGKTLAFQARDTGSIPVTRSKNPDMFFMQQSYVFRMYDCMAGVWGRFHLGG